MEISMDTAVEFIDIAWPDLNFQSQSEINKPSFQNNNTSNVVLSQTSATPLQKIFAACIGASLTSLFSKFYCMSIVN